MTMRLVWPAKEFLPGYVDALHRGWSPDNVRPEASGEELERIARDPTAFLATRIDLDAKGPPVILPDGSIMTRLPGYHKWLWDGEFCGSINLRWQPGTAELPPYCLGHIGYAVVPWKRGRGYATRALAMLLPEASAIGLPYVEITTDVTNVASQRVIIANGGRLIERFYKPAEYGASESLRFRVYLDAESPTTA